jgi:hypothetical protein
MVTTGVGVAQPLGDGAVNCPGFDGGLGGWCLHGLLGLLELTVVQGFVFCGWDVAERAV